MANTKVLLMPIGIPGSGKSTYMEKLVKKLESDGETAIKVSADEYDKLYESNGEINKEKLNAAHNTCLRKVFELMESRTDTIIVDNTNLNMSKWYEYIFLACNNEYRVYFMLPKYGMCYYDTGMSFEKQLEHAKKIRSTIDDPTKPKIVPGRVIDKMYREFLTVRKFISDNKDVCQCDPHLWLKICE